MEGDFAPLEHLAVSGDIGCQNLEEAQGVIRASGGWRPRMLVNIHWTAPTPPNKAYSAQNASTAMVEKPCHVTTVGGHLGLLGMWLQ